MLQSIRILDSLNGQDEAPAKELGEDPTTLLGLLLRAARLWPSNGITFKDQGWDQEASFMSYAELLETAHVRCSTCKINNGDG